MSRIVLEFDADLNPEAQKILGAALQQVADGVTRQVKRTQQGRAANYTEFSRNAMAAAREVERAIHGAGLRALLVDAQRVRVGQVEYVKVLDAEDALGSYHTRAGTVSFQRPLFRVAGERNGPTVDLIALQVGAVAGGWLPDTAEAIAFVGQQGTSREAEALAKKLNVLPYSRSSFEMVTHEVGRRLEERAEEIDVVLAEQAELPEKAASLSVSLDRVSLPMEEPRPRAPGRPRKGEPKRPVSRVFRMAYCGTVTVHDEQGHALHTIRRGCMPSSDPEELVAALARDVAAYREQAVGLPLTELADGAPELWDLLDTTFDGPFGIPYRLIDFWHVIEKLAVAAKVIDADGAPAMLQRWKMRLLNCNSAAQEIVDELVASGKRDTRAGDARPVHEAITYLENNAGRMRYATARRKGLPIGSGNVEATCKSLVQVRMKRPGARWKNETGDHIMHLRALSLSNRWDQAMAELLRPPRLRVKAVA